jgi:hypothetical protein
MPVEFRLKSGMLFSIGALLCSGGEDAGVIQKIVFEIVHVPNRYH